MRARIAMGSSEHLSASAGVSGYFSFGAMVGGAFVGIWAGGVAWFAIVDLLFNPADGETVVWPLRLLARVALVSFPAALIALAGAVPVAIVLSAIVYPLAGWLRAHVAPTARNAAALGGLIGLMLCLPLLVRGMIAGQQSTAQLSMITPFIVGGCTAALVYRALLVYRYPQVLAKAPQASSD